MLASPVVELLACPRDRGTLRLADSSQAERVSAGGVCEQVLLCDRCRGRFPIVDGIVRCLDSRSPGALNRPEKVDEMHARDGEAASYEERFRGIRNAIELPPCLSAMDARAEDVVVELGCGTGRLTRCYAGKVAATVAIDLSLASLRRLASGLDPAVRPRVTLVHGDICLPAARSGVFSKAVSFQVIEHVPTADQRAGVLATVRELLQAGGRFVCTVYNWSRAKQRKGGRGKGDNTSKEGFHRSTPPIYYYNFEADELSSLLGAARFHLELLAGIDLQLPGIRLLGPLGVALNRRLGATPFGLKNGHLLLASAVRGA
jgi:SAM-dependent methyltransferase